MIAQKEMDEMLENSRLDHTFGKRMCGMGAEGSDFLCDLLVKTENIDALLLALRLSKLTEIPLTVIGTGSTIPVTDSHCRGMLVKLSGEFCKFRDQGNLRLVVGAGVTLPKLKSKLHDNGLSVDFLFEGSNGTVGSWFHHLLKTGSSPCFRFIKKAVFLNADTLALEDAVSAPYTGFENHLVLSIQFDFSIHEAGCGSHLGEEKGNCGLVGLPLGLSGVSSL